MRTGAEHKQGKFSVVLVPHHEPVAVRTADMTFPHAGIITHKLVWTILRRKGSCF